MGYVSSPYPTQLDYLMFVKRRRRRSLSRLGQSNAIFCFSWCGLLIQCSQTLVENLEGTEWVRYGLIAAIFLTLQTKNRGRRAKITCAQCQNPSPRVFELSWACLTPECPMFWTHIGGEFEGQPMPDNLDYHSSFLDLPPSQPLPPGFESVGHAEGVAVEMDPIGITTSYTFSRGYHCVNCGRLSCRYVSDSWLW